MEIILKNNQLSLIKKYGHYYIRFIGGMMDEIPCDCEISKEEAELIMQNNNEISTVLGKYKKIILWTLQYFIQSGIEDYMRYEANMSEAHIEKNIEKLNRHEDIKVELYETIMYEAFPIQGAIEVQGYSAEELKNTTKLTTLGAYNYLIYLRESPKEALDNLCKGLPLK